MSLGEPRDSLISFNCGQHSFPLFPAVLFVRISTSFGRKDSLTIETTMRNCAKGRITKKKGDVCKDRKCAYKSIISCKVRIKAEPVFKRSIEEKRERERDEQKKGVYVCLHVWEKERKKGRPVDKRGKIENPVQSFDLLRSSDSIEAAQVLTMDRVGSSAESEIIFMTRINLVLWAVRVFIYISRTQ